METRGSSARAPGRRRWSSTKGAVLLSVAIAVAALLGIGVWAAIAASLSSGSGQDSQAERVEVFTFVESGIVYVDPETSEIIWRNEQRESRTIGEAPWQNPEPTAGAVPRVRPWQENRLIVGNPSHDLVSWVETADGRRGDVVVVRPSTGEEVARAPVEGPADATVVISSVDDEAVYFAVADRNWRFPDVESHFVRVWRYAAGEAPGPGPRSDTVYFNDLSAGISAIYFDSGVMFEGANRRMLSTASYDETSRTDFGGALSPDGRFWYGAETSRIVETATGRVIELPTPVERSYGWTGGAELVLTVCEPGARECQTHTCDVGGAVEGVCVPGFRWSEQAQGSLLGLCAPYGLACGSRMPVL